jgi:hypothetical protein
MPTLTPEQLAVLEKLNDVLFPYSTGRRKAMIDRRGRFVHYTSAENALNIIKAKCFWMRNATCMSDYREVLHGFDAFRRYFTDESTKQAFNLALNDCHPGTAEEAIASFDQAWQGTLLQTYIASIAEHDDREDIHGRLSMWRGFGNSTARVAIVLKVDLGIGKNASLGAELSPVGYFTDAELAAEINSVIANIRKNTEFMRGIDRAWFLTSIVAMLTSGVVCLKHEGFSEEREWRVIHSPGRHAGQYIQSSIEVVSGVPQRVYTLPLRSDPEGGLTGLNPDELIDRIIIGPTQYPFAMYEAFVSALTDVGVADAGKRVFNSQIPVRT